MLSQVRPGSIVILHDGGDSARWATVQALPIILKALDKRGYQVMSISQLLTMHSPTSTAAPAGGVLR